MVYTPKVYVFTKNPAGEIIDVSRYVTQGTINRRVNAVSTAEITLRNPKMMFTTPDANHRTTFTSMDPVTIYLKRIRNRPVRVFTGFLDKTPYLQLYPGTITLNCSCTLKRLLYTYFDPALPYTLSFFQAYGWVPGESGQWYSEDAMNDWQNRASQDPNRPGKDETVDSSLSNLLYATMHYIGRWATDQIFIEKLPKDIFARLTYMSKQFEADNEKAWKEFQELFKKIIGEGDYTGSGSGAGDQTNPDLSGIDGDVATQVYKTGQRMHMGQQAMIAAFMTGINESNMRNLDHGDSSSVGWRQELDTYGSVAERMNVPKSAARFFNEIKAYMSGNNPSAEARRGPYSNTMPAGWVADAVQRPASRSVYGDNPGLHERAVALLRKIADQVEKDSGGTNSPAAADLEKITRANGKSDTKSDKTSDSSSGTTIRDKIVQVAKDSMGAPPTTFYSQGGAMTDKLHPAHGERSDCSQWARAVYLKAGAPDPGTFTGAMLQKGKPTDKPLPGDLLCGNNHVEIYIGNGRTIGHGSDPIDYGTVAYFKSSQPDMHMITYDGLGDEYHGSTGSGADAAGGGGSGGGGGNNDAGAAAAGAFFGALQLPSMMDAAEAVALGGEKSLMNDKPLLPFIQQMCEASLRSFQSMPDGKFFAFYPDYFGEMNHRPPYWEIDDIEVLDGTIYLTDDAVVTHYYVVGDTLNPISGFDGPQWLRSVFSAGVVTVFNAFMSDEVLARQDTEATQEARKREERNTKRDAKGPAPLPGKDDPRGMDIVLSRAEAVAFLQRYGARPQVDDMPMIKHPFFEMFLAYQRFMLAWSKQFTSTFTFTFMPELFPGGKVGFPDHGLQMYIEEVTHMFSYTDGFTTQAVLTAPSVYGDNVRDLPPNMVKAIIEPVAGAK